MDHCLVQRKSQTEEAVQNLGPGLVTSPMKGVLLNPLPSLRID